MIPKNRLPFWVALICCTEIFIYCWSFWTSTFEPDNFFSIAPVEIFDKCARIAARISSAIHLAILLMVGFYGIKKIYADSGKRDRFLTLMTLFTLNHLIHLLFVVLRFRSHAEAISLAGPISIGGTMQGAITFAFIVIMPFALLRYKILSGPLYLVIIIHLLNVGLL